MQRCTKCLMTDQRPGLTFNEEGVCSACQHFKNRKNVDYEARWHELEELCEKHKKLYTSGYNCIIAVSSGKDSHFQVGTFKEKLGMNPLLVSVGDNFTMTEAGKHNLANIKKEFGCGLMAWQPNIKEQIEAGRYMFEKFAQPTWYVDRLIYTFPTWISKFTGIKLLVYGENISYEYGGVSDTESPSALEQINNGVAANIDYRSLGWKEPFLDAPPTDGMEPIYLSYYLPWNSHENYMFAKSRGFHDLVGEWRRTQHADDYDQIDTIAYLVHPWLKFVKFGHAFATDFVSREIRYGRLTREEGIELVKKHDPFLDQKCVEDFCQFYGYTPSEFWAVVDKFYNTGLFEKDGKFGWKLKEDIE